LSPPAYGPPDGDAELREYAALMAQAFAIAPDRALEWARDKGAEQIRLLRGNGVEAGLALYRFGQFFGGNSVPAWGVAGVAVRPELRSHGRAVELMRRLLLEMHAAGVAISPLYPATRTLYQKLGWDIAGTRLLYELEPARIPFSARPQSLTPISDVDEEIHRRYRLSARHHNGHLDRNAQIWSRITQAAAESPLCGYLAGDAGYILFTQQRSPDQWPYEIFVRDIVSGSPQGLRSLISLLAGHGTQVSRIILPAAPDSPLLRAALPGQAVAVHERFDWMLRIVRVKEALLARGYPTSLSGEAIIQVRDAQIAENEGPCTLQLENGRLSVAEGGAGPVLDVRGLAALYTGALATRPLRMLGLLEGDTRHDSFLDAMFAGPPPWMPDFF
jgi:predicted acetyltransferase